MLNEVSRALLDYRIPEPLIDSVDEVVTTVMNANNQPNTGFISITIYKHHEDRPYTQVTSRHYCMYGEESIPYFFAKLDAELLQHAHDMGLLSE